MRRRRRFSGDLKAKVALEALRSDRTLQEIASKYQVHPNQVSTWKRQAIEGLGEVFSNGVDRRRLGCSSDPLVLITGLPFLSYAKMCICERCLAGNVEGTMTKSASGSTADLSGMPSRDFGSIQIFSIGT